MEKELSMTGQQSLDLIAQMLRNTQDRFERGAGRPFVFFGYVTVAVSLAVWFALKTTGNPQWHWLWFAIPLVGGVRMQLFFSQKPKTVVTFIDRAVWQVWWILGTCAILIMLYTFFVAGDFPTLLVIPLLMFAGEAITGSIIKLRYIQIMGLIGILLSFGLSFLSGLDQILGFAGLFLIAMVIPGHIMNAQAKKASPETAQTDGHV
jgi:hypothetical protein